MVNDNHEHYLLYLFPNRLPNITLEEKCLIVDFLAKQGQRHIDIEVVADTLIRRQSSHKDILPMIERLNAPGLPNHIRNAHITSLLGPMPCYDVIKKDLARHPMPSPCSETSVDDYDSPILPTFQEESFQPRIVAGLLINEEIEGDLRLTEAFTSLSQALDLVTDQVNVLPIDDPKYETLQAWRYDVTEAFDNISRNQAEPLATRIQRFATEVRALQTEAFRDAINEHRGILGFLDNALRGLSAIFLCRLPSRGTFFKTHSQNLVDDVQDKADTLSLKTKP